MDLLISTPVLIPRTAVRAFKYGNHVSPPFELDPGVFYTYFYNHAHRLRLEKLLYLELSRSPNGFFKVILDPGGGFTSETAKWIQKYYSFVTAVSELKRPLRNCFGSETVTHL
jgi:hypothetical protein